MPLSPGFGAEREARLASQARYYWERLGESGPVRLALESRVKGYTQAEYTRAVSIGRRLETARVRAQTAGGNTLLKSLFRGNLGINEGATVHVQVRVPTSSGGVRIVTVPVESASLYDTLGSIKSAALEIAEESDSEGKYNYLKEYDATLWPVIDPVIIGIVPLGGAP